MKSTTEPMPDGAMYLHCSPSAGRSFRMDPPNLVTIPLAASSSKALEMGINGHEACPERRTLRRWTHACTSAGWERSRVRYWAPRSTVRRSSNSLGVAVSDRRHSFRCATGAPECGVHAPAALPGLVPHRDARCPARCRLGQSSRDQSASNSRSHDENTAWLRLRGHLRVCADVSAGMSSSLVARVSSFWFKGLGESPGAMKELMGLWFGGGTEIDSRIRDLFAGDVEAAGRGEYAELESSVDGTLSLIILLEYASLQFPLGRPC